LFYNLKWSAKRQILIGQQNPDETFLGAAGESDIKKVTGNDPAVWGSQVRESSVVREDGRNLFHEDLQKNLRLAAAAYDKGMVNTFWWCLTELGYRKQPVPRDLYTVRFGAALADPSIELAYLMFWRQGRSEKDGYFVPPPGADTLDDFLKFVRDSKLGFLPKTRSLYAIDGLALPASCSILSLTSGHFTSADN
jgi:hypothetical protein